MSTHPVEPDNTLRMLRGAVFFGVPNQGLRVDHLMRVVEGRPNRDLIENLSEDSIYLAKLQIEFAFEHPELQSKIIYVFETLESDLLKVYFPLLAIRYLSEANN
jgi:hypothetical protein